MRIPLILFAAEFEQAATATAVLDVYPREQSWDAVDALYDRYGRPGVDLADEYENEIYSIEHGRPVVGVLFH
jgi:hypothetical protein